MPSYSVAATKDNLSRLIDKALAGEEVVITRHGKPTAELKAVVADTSITATRRSRAEWLAWLEQRRAELPQSDISAADLVRQMRDQAGH